MWGASSAVRRGQLDGVVPQAQPYPGWIFPVDSPSGRNDNRFARLATAPVATA